MTSFKVMCWTRNDVNGATNALRFADKPAAERYGADLFCRWTALDRYKIEECDDPVTHYWDYNEGKAKAFPETR